MDLYLAALFQGLGYAALGLGIYISLRIFNIPDITTDGSYTFGGAITAWGLIAGVHPMTVLLLAISGGAVAGIATGVIHTRLKVQSLLAGILVMTALYSINLGVMGRSNVPVNQAKNIFDLLPEEFVPYGVQMLFPLFILVLVMALNYVLKSDFGIAMRATGNSEQMVRAMGVNTRNMKILGLALANGLTALSGFMMVQYQGFADINMGIGIVISGLAAVMIGQSAGRLFRSNRIVLQLLLVVVGSILFRMILAVALDLGFNPNYLKLITALMVLVVLLLTRFRRTEP
jgi:putative ABC transport system permease protein